MAWTTPKTWVSEVLTSNDMNTYLSDNTQFLYDQLTAGLAEYTYTRAGAVDYSTTSTTAVDIDATNMVATLTTGGGDLLVNFTGSIYRSGGTAQDIVITVLLDGAPYQLRQRLDSGSFNVSFTRVFNNVSAGSHTLRMRWALTVSGATMTLNGLHSHFSIRELAQ